MTVEFALFTEIKGAQPISAIAADRVYPVTMPEPEKGAALKPSLVIVQSGRSEEMLMGGTPLMFVKHFQLSACAESYNDAHELADALSAFLYGWNTARNGLMGGATGVDVQCVDITDQFDTVDDRFELGFYVVQTDVTISYRQ